MFNDTSTLNLTTTEGTKLDLPANAVRIIEEADEGKGCTLIYNLGNGNASDKLNDNYGYVKKKLTDIAMLGDGIELKIAHAPDKSHRVYQSKANIIALRELKDHANGAKCRVTVKVDCPPFGLDVLETRDFIAGEA